MASLIVVGIPTVIFGALFIVCGLILLPLLHFADKFTRFAAAAADPDDKAWLRTH